MQKHADFSMPFLTVTQIKHRKSRARWIYWTLLVMVVLANLGVWKWIEHSATRDLGSMPWALTVITTSLMWLMLLATLRELRWDARQYEWLEAATCGTLATLCELNPELVAYRNRVRDTGRRFTNAEFRAMRDCVLTKRAAEERVRARAEELEGCQKLYGITD